MSVGSRDKRGNECKKKKKKEERSDQINYREMGRRGRGEGLITKGGREGERAICERCRIAGEEDYKGIKG